MKPRRIDETSMKKHCTEVGPEDGIDPRDIVRQSMPKKGGRKTLQLCGQVGEAINYALSGVCDVDVLRDLAVVTVNAVPDESHLVVTLAPALPGPVDAGEVAKRLQVALPKIRAEVAASITRKRMPELAFIVMRHEQSA